MSLEQPESPEPTEQEILASVFYHCDTQKTGLVAVSQILEFLTRTKPDWDFGELQSLLDPIGENPTVDIDGYQRGISQWVQSVRSVVDDGGDTPDGELSYGESSSECLASGGAEASIRVVMSASNNVTTRSNVLEATSGDASRSWEHIEAMAALQESQQQVRHLAAENELLHRSVATAEEQNTALLHEVDELRAHVAKQNLLLSRKQQLEHATDESSDDEHRQFQPTADRIAQLEKEKAQLEMNLTRSDDERLQLTVQVEQLQEEFHSAVEMLNSNPATLRRELNASMEHSTNLESFVNDLSTANQALLSDKRHLESLISDMRDQEILPSSVYGNPLVHSTPMRRADTLHDELLATQESSVDSELHSSLPFGNDQLPTALSPAVNGTSEWRSAGFGVGSDTVHGGLHSHHSLTNITNIAGAGGSLHRGVNKNSSSEDLMSVLSSVRHHFHAKKSLALRQLAELSDCDSQTEEGSISESSVDVSINSFANFESKLSRLVASRKAAVEKASKLDKSNALLTADVENLRNANQGLEERIRTAEQKTETAVLSLEDVCRERDAFVADVADLRQKLGAKETELDEVRVELEELRGRGGGAHTCRECGRIMSTDLDDVVGEGSGDSVAGDSTHSSRTRSPATPKSITLAESLPFRSSPVLISGGDSQAIAALLKGLPSEYNLLRTEPGLVEQHYFNISEILQDLCESAEGCPETVRRAKEDAETRAEWCIRQFTALSATSDECDVPVDRCASDQLVTQLKYALHLARLAGRNEQDFVYLSLIKVLVQYVNLIRLEVFLPGKERLPIVVNPSDSPGQFIVELNQQNLPRSSSPRWPSHQGGSFTDEDGSWERSGSSSRPSSHSSTSKSITTVFHEAYISHRRFGDVFPPTNGKDTIASRPSDLQSTAEQCSKVMELIDQRKQAHAHASSRRSVLLRWFLHVFLLIVILIVATFAFLAPSSLVRDGGRSAMSFWSLLPLESLGAQYSIAPFPVT